MPLTVLRSAMNRPVRYSAKCRRSGSLANRSAYWAKRSCTTVGNSTIAGIGAPADASGGSDCGDNRTTETRAVQLCKTTVTSYIQRDDGLNYSSYDQYVTQAFSMMVY